MKDATDQTALLQGRGRHRRSGSNRRGAGGRSCLGRCFLGEQVNGRY